MSSIGHKYSEPFKFLCEGTQKLNTPQEIFFKILNNINHNLAVFSSRFNIFFHTENHYKINWIWSDHDVKDLKLNILENDLQGRQNIDVKSKNNLSIFEKTFFSVFQNKEYKNILIKNFKSFKPSDKCVFSEKTLPMIEQARSRPSLELIEARKTEHNNFKMDHGQENLLIKSFDNLKSSAKFNFSEKALRLIDHTYSCTTSDKLIGVGKIKNNYITIEPKQECRLFKLDFTVFLSKITQLFFGKDIRETPFKIHYVEEEWEGNDGCSEEESFVEDGNDANSIGEDYQYDEDYYENTHVIPAFNEQLVIDESAHSEPEYMIKSHLRENLHGCGFEDSSGNGVDDLRDLRNMIHQLVQLAYANNNQLRDSLGPWGGRIAPKNRELKHLAHQLKFGRWTEKEAIELIIKVLDLYESGYRKMNRNEIKQTKEMILLHYRIIQEGYKLNLFDSSSDSDADSGDISSDSVDQSDDDTFIPI